MQEKKRTRATTAQKRKKARSPAASRVLVTCAPVLGKVAMDSMASALPGYIFVEDDGQY